VTIESMRGLTTCFDWSRSWMDTSGTMYRKKVKGLQQCPACLVWT